ncbi:MAG: metal cation transporter [Natronomonas sp.]
MSAENIGWTEDLPDWILAFGPFLVLAAVATPLFFVVSTVDLTVLGELDSLSAFGVLTAVGIVAGILPVAVGMLWFPYVRRLDATWIHAVLALSAGVLAFIAVEMAEETIEFSAAVSTPLLGETVAVVGVLGTLLVMEAASRWRQSKSVESTGDGLRVAYLVAIGLGLHSIGEGLAIGSAFALENWSLLALLTLGFIIHNVTEGPAVVSAVARDAESPPLRHFAALGVLAGGGVVIGGWLGSTVTSPLVATTFFAIAFGAILQVVWEMVRLIQRDAGSVVTRRTVAAFVVGAFLMFFLEEVVVDGLLL